MIDDPTLLRRYAAERAEEAFAEFVHRNLPFVYSAAVRRLGGDAHRAKDVAQVVFCAAARDAHRLSQHARLAGWLYTATRYAAADFNRSEKRRRVREEEAHIMQETLSDSETPADWSRLRPVLDTAMDALSSDDREAVLLRFFQGRAYAEIGTVLGSSEDAARKRVDRALDKLRDVLCRHKIASTSAALATLLAGESVSAAPAGIAPSITGAALSAGGTTTGGVALMTLTKLQVGIAAVLIAGGAVGLVMQQRAISNLRETATNAGQQVARLAAENTAVAKTRADADTEVARLRAEVAALTQRPVSEKRVGNAAPATAPKSPVTASAQNPAADLAAKQAKKADLHQRYDPFLQKWGIPPAQADRFVELKIAIYEAQDDLQGAVRQAGAKGGTAGVEALRSQLVTPLWDEIRQILGKEAYKAYGAYEEFSFLQLSYLDPLIPAFSSANVPLTPQQSEQLVQIFAAHRRSVRANPTDIYTTGSMNWEAVVAQAGGILTPEQTAVLQAHAGRRSSSKR